MTKYTFFCFLLILTIFASACTNGTNSNANTANNSPKEGVKPVADPEIAVLDTDYGTIKIELYSNIAPKMVARFKELAGEGFYNGTSFHRINPNLGIIQGGDPNSKDDNPANDGSGSSQKPNVPAEFSDISYETGIVGAARTMEIDTANCQFFIMTKRQPAFDKHYTIFGKVIEGQNNVNIIANAPTAPPVAPGAVSERPDQKIKIKSVTIQKR